MRQADIKEGEDYLVAYRSPAWGNDAGGYRATVVETGATDPDQKRSGLPRTVRIRWGGSAPPRMAGNERYVASVQVVRSWEDQEKRLAAKEEAQAEDRRVKAAADESTREVLKELGVVDWVENHVYYATGAQLNLKTQLHIEIGDLVDLLKERES